MDEQHYMEIASQSYLLLQHPKPNTIVEMMQIIPFRQPGYSFFILPFLLIFGLTHSYQIALLLNALFLCGSILGVYFLAREYFDRTLSLVASVFFMSYGWTLFYLHFTYSETATTCFVVLSLLFLKKSNYFQNTKYSLLFGLTFGIGMFTRWVTAIFLCGPLIVVLGYIIYKREHLHIIIRNIILICILFLVPASFVYIINAHSFFGEYFKDQFLGGQVWNMVPAYRKSHISLQSAAYYFKVLEQLNIFYFVLFIIGGILAIFDKKKKYIFIISAFIVPYLLFSFATIIKDDRYIVPIYPIISIISVVAIEKIKNHVYQTLCIIFFLLIAIGSFFGGLWGIGPMEKGLQSVLIPMPIGHPRLVHLTSMVWPPTKNNTHVDELFQILSDDSKKNEIKNLQIIQLFSYHPVDIGIYATNRYEKENPYNFINFVGMTTIAINTPKDVTDMVDKSNYVIVKNKNRVDAYFPKNNYTVLTRTIDTWNKLAPILSNNFTLVKSIYVPIDKSTITIYRKIKPLSDEQKSLFEQQFLDPDNAVLPEQ